MVTTYRLNTAKLMRDVDRMRRAGAQDEISYRRLAALIGAGSSSVFTRLRAGQPPHTDVLCSLLMWLNPAATIADYALDSWLIYAAVLTWPLRPVEDSARSTQNVPGRA